MSLRRVEAKHAAAALNDSDKICATCMSMRVVIVEGREWAQAKPCPDCASSCSTCRDTGYVFERNAWGSVDSQFCPTCQPRRTKIALYNQAQIPRRYASTKFSDFKHDHDDSVRRVYMRFQSFLNTFKPGDRGIGLSGGVGNGKTLIMALFLRQLTITREIPCRFIEFSHLLSDIRAGYDAGRSEAEIIAHLVDVPILVIDELGKALKTEWQLAILDELISRRYNRNVSTFFTTNFPFTAPNAGSHSLARDDFRVTSLEERVGARIYSRLCEMAEFHTFATAPDMRRNLGDARVASDAARGPLNRR